jgi:hypothetical protein
MKFNFNVAALGLALFGAVSGDGEIERRRIVAVKELTQFSCPVGAD